MGHRLSILRIRLEHSSQQAMCLHGRNTVLRSLVRHTAHMSRAMSLVLELCDYEKCIQHYISIYNMLYTFFTISLYIVTQTWHYLFGGQSGGALIVSPTLVFGLWQPSICLNIPSSWSRCCANSRACAMSITFTFFDVFEHTQHRLLVVVVDTSSPQPRHLSMVVVMMMFASAEGCVSSSMLRRRMLLLSSRGNVCRICVLITTTTALVHKYYVPI